MRRALVFLLCAVFLLPSLAYAQSGVATTGGHTAKGHIVANSKTVHKIAMNKSIVTKIQQKLKAKGFYKKAVDGVFGPATKAALKKFQAAVGLKVDGIYGPKTKAALGL